MSPKSKIHKSWIEKGVRRLQCPRNRIQLENGRGMTKNSSPRLVLDLKTQRSKVSSLKGPRKRSKFRGIPRLVLEKAEEKGKIPRLVSSSTSEKFYQRSRPRPRPRQMTPREPLRCCYNHIETNGSNTHTA